MKTGLTDNQKIRLVIDYENGFKSGVIAKHYGVSYMTVRNILRSHGIIPCNGNQIISGFLKENICISYIDGMSTRQVGNMYGIENSTVLKILIDNEIPRRKKGHPFVLEETLRIIGPAEMVALGLAEEYYLNHKMANEVSSLRHQIEGEPNGQNNC